MLLSITRIWLVNNEEEFPNLGVIVQIACLWGWEILWIYWLVWVWGRSIMHWFCDICTGILYLRHFLSISIYFENTFIMLLIHTSGYNMGISESLLNLLLYTWFKEDAKRPRRRCHTIHYFALWYVYSSIWFGVMLLTFLDENFLLFLWRFGWLFLGVYF